MIQKFKSHLAAKFPFLKNKNLLLATSGGIDSMVMVDLCTKLGYNFGMLHCNFKLRGAESDADMKFVMDHGDKFLIPWSVGHFETKKYAKENKVSIQVAARELRYDWFEEQLIKKDFDYILTAHQLDDCLETFFINISRGTGLDGLVGIPAQNDKIIRPLLIFSRQEIEVYAKENHIKWREDSSNAKNDYLRNKIRQHIIPELIEISPTFLESFQKTQSYLQESQVMVEDATVFFYEQIAEHISDEIHFNITKLRFLPNYKSYLYQWLKEYNFKSWNDIYNLIDAQSGKKVASDLYQIIKNRDFLILSLLTNKQESNSFFIEKNQFEVKFPVNLVLLPIQEIKDTDQNSIFVDQDKLTFPLEIRNWHDGDNFKPFGMDGKSKKVSKLFKDEKLSILEKNKIWIVTSNNQIVWIIGYRQDERFRIDKSTKNKLQLILK